MAQTFQSGTDFTLESVVISPADGSAGLQIKQLVQIFNYVESVDYPCVMGSLVIVDSAGLINTLPIQGGEIVNIRVKTNADPNGVDYIMRVWKIANRFAKNKDQTYNLGIVSEEALNDEFARVEKPLTGKADEIINTLLKETLKTSKTFYSEPSYFSSKIIPSRKRAFDIAAMLARKSVPASNPRVPTSAETTNAPKQQQEQKVGGSAGYLFWENRRGYNFFSVDALCSDTPIGRYNGQPWGPYVETIAASDDGGDDRFRIANIMFTSEIDLLTSMRMGKYSTKMCFFNHTTGQYDEYVYGMNDAFEDMKHLGSQQKPSLIKLGPKKFLSDYPTGLISALLDHETWYNEAKPASHEERDGATSPSLYTDRHLDFAAQSIVRYETLEYQRATMVVPGNSQICAGDKVDIRITNKLPGEGAKTEPTDPENSGVYLIMEVTHEYNTLQSTNGTFTTTLRIARDTHGVPDKVSKHGTK